MSIVDYVLVTRVFYPVIIIHQLLDNPVVVITECILTIQLFGVDKLSHKVLKRILLSEKGFIPRSPQVKSWLITSFKM